MIKTYNYLDKTENKVKTAYGLVQVDTVFNKATLYIGASRELLEKKRYYEKVTVDMRFDRTQVPFNPIHQAYDFFKKYKIMKFDGEQPIEYQPFADWVDEYGRT